MRGSILGIQAKEETNNTHQPKRNLPSRGGSRERGAAKALHTPHHKTRQKKGGEEPGGSRGQRENMTHPHQEGYERALAESREGPRIIR